MAFVEEGAIVTVIAPWICEDLTDLVTTGEIAWLERDYVGVSDLDGARLVHTATGEAAADDRVLTDADTVGIWCVHAGDAGATRLRSSPARRSPFPTARSRSRPTPPVIPGWPCAPGMPWRSTWRRVPWRYNAVGDATARAGWRSSAEVREPMPCSPSAADTCCRPPMSSSSTASPPRAARRPAGLGADRRRRQGAGAACRHPGRDQRGPVEEALAGHGVVRPQGATPMSSGAVVRSASRARHTAYPSRSCPA